MQNVFFSVPQPAVDCKEKLWFYLCFRVTIKTKINEREVYEGMDIVDTIAQTAVDESQKPTTDITINSVSIETYQG